jgi:hypothetical protein
MRLSAISLPVDAVGVDLEQDGDAAATWRGGELAEVSAGNIQAHLAVAEQTAALVRNARTAA